jgi:hypothetical protein
MPPQLAGRLSAIRCFNKLALTSAATPDRIAGHLPVLLPRSPFRGRPSCNLSPPSFGRGGLVFVNRRLVDGEARSVDGDGPGRSFVRVGDLGPKDKLGLLRRVFGAAHDSVNPSERWSECWCGRA